MNAVTLPCACGGFVTAKRSAPQYALLSHYRSAAHRLSHWGLATLANGMSTFLDPYEAQEGWPTAQQSTGDVSRRKARASAASPDEPAA